MALYFEPSKVSKLESKLADTHTYSLNGTDLVIGWQALIISSCSLLEVLNEIIKMFKF